MAAAAPRHTSGTRVQSRPALRVARIIGRLNIGGPAVQALLLSTLLPRRGIETALIRGVEGPDEGNMDHLAAELGVAPIRLGWMRRDVGWRDLVALAALRRAVVHLRPNVVHTEAAKAGALGRVAALLIPRARRPVLVHTFHGHSLEGYFSPRRARFFLAVERFLARRTDLLIAVSPEVKGDLVRLGVAPAEKITVVPLGLDLRAFTVGDPERLARRHRKRADWDVGDGISVVTLVARLVPIKRVDRFLSMAATLASEHADMRFVVAGDGELRDQLVSSPAARALGERLIWTGFQRDMPDVCFASDVVVLTSDNEGTPVSLIEAQAASVPVVGTRVGGTASALVDGISGFLVEPDDVDGLAAAVIEALARPLEIGRAGQTYVLERFGAERLAGDLEQIYRRLCDAVP